MKSIQLMTGSLLRRPIVAATALVIAAGAAKAADYPTTILGDNPVAYYRFEELPGATTAIDSSPTQNNATYEYDSAGMVPELGLPGIDTNSIGFTGEASSDYGYVDIPFNPLLAPVAADGVHGAAFSIECWAQSYTANIGGGYMSLVGMFGTYGGAPYGNASGWLLGATPGPGSQWLFNLRNGGFLFGAATAVVPLQWTHLVGTFDGTNEYFYINGALAYSAGGITGYLPDPSYDGAVGAVANAGLVPSGPYSTFNGGVDEVAFYTNALTLAQIQTHYQVGTNSFRVVPTPPGILTQPSDETNYSGTEVSFTVTANGTTPLYYQWSRQGVGPIAGATDATYSFVSQYPADNGAGFSVLITNSVSSTNSQTVTLTVQTNLNILGPPFSITRNVGSHAAFRVAAGGALPLGYQWSASTNSGTSFSLLPGQTADTLWLTNVQMTDSGNQYAVIVTNPFTSYSNSATLSVQARAVNVALSGYSAIVAADQPVAYWLLNEASNSVTATDAVGSFDGAYDTNYGTIAWGIPTGIPNNPVPGVDLQDAQTTTAGQGGTVDIPYALELNPFGPWSMEAWIRPDSVDGQFRVPISSMSNPDSGNFVSGWLIYEYGSIPSYWTMVIFNGGASGSFGTDFGDAFSTPGTWNHLVITDDGVNILFYVNGQVGSSFTVASSGYAPQGINGDPSLAGDNEVLGQRSDLAFFGGNAGTADVAFYNYALSPAQIQSHYLNKASFTYTRSGNSVTLTWPAGVLLGSSKVNGPYTPVATNSPYTIPAGIQQFFYQVEVP
ncbi:MAG: LamG-like jellyroll fold domain-containing protein [Verrucomicrobiota bacterium]|jgi:hypothetical protein